MLILASASQARKRLLEKLSIDYRIMVSHIDENKFEDSNIKSLVQKLSVAKAGCIDSKFLLNDFDQELKKTVAILGCDSLFEFNGIVFGKPKTHKDAIDRWKLMSGKSGVLHTGHCLMYKTILDVCTEGYCNGLICDVISTKINFSNLSEKEIVDYVETEEPMNCAGGFAIDGKGAAFIESIEGCFSNVIGLSLPWLREALNKVLIAE